MKVRKKALVRGSFRESVRQKKLNQLQEKWKAKGWDILEVYDGARPEALTLL